MRPIVSSTARPDVRATPLPDAYADRPRDFAPCARCGAWTKLEPHRAANGAVVWLQPTHRCADGLITEAIR
jgi:hypothetical protein